MRDKKNTFIVVAIALVFAVGLGIAIGVNIGSKDNQMLKDVDDVNNSVPSSLVDANLEQKSVDELNAMLSEIMLPEDEFEKLESAIFQTAMGLLMAQAQGAGVEVTAAAEEELRKGVDQQYSRKYFADVNAESMKELSKDELVAILSFYNTTAGAKFLKLSPKIIEGTMSAVQADLSQWLPKTVDSLVSKLKNKEFDNNDTPDQDMEQPNLDEDKQ